MWTCAASGVLSTDLKEVAADTAGVRAAAPSTLEISELLAERPPPHLL